MCKYIIFFIISTLLLVNLSSCEVLTKKNEKPSPSENVVDENNGVSDGDSKEKLELTLWAHYGEDWEYSFKEFNKAYPEIEIKVETFTYESYEEKYIEALLSGNVPDIMVFDSDQFRNFKDIDGLEDLSKEPYNAETYKNDFPPSLWQIGKSIDNRKIIGIPFSTTPLVTFYRKDLMERYGFPSDPEELATFMEDPNNWLTIAKTLKKDDRWIMQWPNQLLNIYESSTSLFTNDFLFNRNNEVFKDAITLSQIADKDKLAAHFDIYMPEGKKALEEGRLAMLYLGTYGDDQLEEIVPKQAGKWRATRLPFNVYGWSNSTIFSIPINSDHKESAWEFIKFYSFELMKQGFIGSVPGYMPARNNPSNLIYHNKFLGGQQTQRLYEDIMNKTQEHFITPLDEEAEQIWKENIDSTIQWNIDATTALEKITQDMNQNLGQKQKILRDLIK
ncbi:ABC transporter substrate-binding protein [Metabacillus halosaccharovorans]|uniref:Extracellular solute-binding protein n=1 Tax=Metabacillus halosaccharovorans TaxID=930124 RepID=A0ABT3DNP0_9BACI|nr:extracellular solute-binding protein [Metabacillus halosaccharovorans]MCV9888690.1 extracellular solute-binding protein [Metabacillus halosaccharovorans]